ncbi:hypothetical protein SAMN02745121_06397 [Nannocystis exedens]|uniref:Uncharacterized protein n=1 Tax=Nannocystis exedens TaxID=54 RepID=A0A1I2F0Z0_9BACT|nr:hypothetical protein NAEX_02612 [Nannocystis exedens]SFE98825.1 hypothetical protein SAMN02745121_06397 [Nannocystis exedens]
MFRSVATKQVPSSRLIGGRVADSGAFPDTHDAYRDMTPTQRIALMRELSRRVYAISQRGSDGGERRSGLSDRLIGGRR